MAGLCNEIKPRKHFLIGRWLISGWVLGANYAIGRLQNPAKPHANIHLHTSVQNTLHTHLHRQANSHSCPYIHTQTHIRTHNTQTYPEGLSAWNHPVLPNIETKRQKRWSTESVSTDAHAKHTDIHNHEETHKDTHECTPTHADTHTHEWAHTIIYTTAHTHAQKHTKHTKKKHKRTHAHAHSNSIGRNLI